MQQTNLLLQHQAHLWIGNQNTLQQKIIAQLQQILCTNQGCQNCATCKQIENQQHPWIHWLQPDGSYNIDQIDEILTTVRFKLHSGEHRFFIFTQADELNAHCNNRLLKTIEEPHAGYIFIFLTSRTDTILPTLVSRCFVKEVNDQHQQAAYHEIIQPFTSNSFTQPIEFIKLIDKYEIKERETKDIIDTLIQIFHHKLITVHGQQTPQIDEMIKITDKILILKQALTKLPPPGSAKLFWKNVYLQFHAQL